MVISPQLAKEIVAPPDRASRLQHLKGLPDMIISSAATIVTSALSIWG
jgi:hypothetical protein